MAFELSLFNNGLLDRRAEKSIMECNEETVNYGLVLSESDVKELIITKNNALVGTGRVEFGGSIVERLIYKFCDSPYIMQSNYAETINDLVEVFYYLKNETLDSVSDDELLDAMKASFDGACAGSVDLLAGRDMVWYSRNRRYKLYNSGEYHAEGEPETGDIFRGEENE